MMKKVEADERIQGRNLRFSGTGGSRWWFTSAPSCSMEKASEKSGPRNLCGCSHGKPHLREAMEWGVCGQVSSHPEAFGHRFHICWGLESLVPVTILTTTAPKAGNAISERLEARHCCPREPAVRPRILPN